MGVDDNGAERACTVGCFSSKIARILLDDNNRILETRESVTSTDSEEIGGSTCLGASWLFFQDCRLTSPIQSRAEACRRVDTATFDTI